MRYIFTIIGACIALALSFSLGLWMGSGIRAAEVQPPLTSSDQILQNCVDRAHTTIIRPADLAQQQNYENSIASACYSQTSSQLLLRDFEVRRQMFLASQQAGQGINYVAMIILLFATTSGVILSGLQIFTSYRLMSKGYEQAGINTELVMKYNSIALRSSAVGVSIFAISVLFSRCSFM